MSVTRHPKDPNKWIIDYWPDGRKGKRVRKVIIGTQDNALEFERRFRQIHIEKVRPAINPRVKDVLPEYLRYLGLHRSARYKDDMEKAFKQLSSSFGNVQLNKITVKLLNDYKHTRPRPKGIHEGKSGVCAINKELRYLVTFHAWAVKQGYATPLPFKVEKLPYKPELQEVAHPSDIEGFLSAIKPRGKKPIHRYELDRKKALIRFLLDCGLRWIEASSIRWEDIDFNHGIVYLKRTKGDRPDTAFLPDSIRELLEYQKRPVGYVFENTKTGLPWKSMKTLFKGASSRAKIKPIRPHQLRRTGATLMLEATGDMRLVQEFLRHKSIITTQVYTKVSKSRLKEAMAKTAVYVDSLKADKQLKNKGKKKG